MIRNRRWSAGSRHCRPMLERLEGRQAPAVITVTSLADNLHLDSRVTLREAILSANSDASVDGSVAGSGDDIIRFAGKLTRNGPRVINLTGVLPAFISNIDLQGPGADKLTVRRSSGGDYRIFTIAGGVTASISGLTVANGQVGGQGGGLFNAGALLLSDCVVAGNRVLGTYPQAADYSFAGGGIFNNGVLTVLRSTIRQNSAEGAGGGLFNAGTLTVLGSTVAENATLRVAPAEALFAGGGIFNLGMLEMSGSTVAANVAGGDGGGLFNYHTATVRTSRIRDNSADGGGGFSNSAEDQFEAPPAGLPAITLTILNCTISGNVQTGANGSGGGGRNLDTLLIVHSALLDNESQGGFGGGGLSAFAGTATLINCTLAGNTTTSFLGGGGIIHFFAPLHLLNCTVVGNSASIGGGGGIWNNEAVTINNTLIAQNSAADGPDVFGPVDGAASFNNLIGDGSDLTGISNGDANSNQVGDSVTPIDPRLTALGDHGGPTPTFALLPGSPAIDAGADAQLPADTRDLDGDGDTAEAIPFDQRGGGFARTVGPSVDIGAYESGRIFAAGADRGRPPLVKVFDASGAELASFLAYGAAYRGGVRVAVGDVSGDGVADIITAPGRNRASRILIFDGTSHLRLASLPAGFLVFPAAFQGGVFVAAGNFDGDAAAEIVVGKGTGSRVRVYDIAGGTATLLAHPLGDFSAFGAGYTGGVRVAAGDIDGNPGDEIIVGKAASHAQVRVFATDGLVRTILQGFQPFGPLTRGVFVAVGDVNGDTQIDIIMGAGAGGPARVKIVDGADPGLVLGLFSAYRSSTQGLRVASVDRDGDGDADLIVTATGNPGGSDLRLFDALTLQQLDQFFAFAPPGGSGAFVGA